VSVFKDNHLKTQIGEGLELWVPIWHSGMPEAFLTHVWSAQEAFKKKGYFKAYEENNEAYVELRGKIMSAKTFTQVVWRLRDVPPSHHVPKQCGWAGAVLHHECAEKAPMHKHSSVCAACRTDQLLHLTTAMPVLQPKREGRHDSHECGFSRGWSSQSRSSDVPTYVAGSVQPSQERIESHVCTKHGGAYTSIYHTQHTRLS
jgi:hypothetical protein